MKYNINFMNMLKLLLVIIGIFLIIRILNVKNNKIQEGFDATINDAFVLDINHLEGELKINDNRQDYLDGITNVINMAELTKLKHLIDFQKNMNQDENSRLPKDGFTKDNFHLSSSIVHRLMKYDYLIDSLKKTQEFINGSDGGGVGIF